MEIISIQLISVWYTCLFQSANEYGSSGRDDGSVVSNLCFSLWSRCSRVFMTDNFLRLWIVMIKLKYDWRGRMYQQRGQRSCGAHMTTMSRARWWIRLFICQSVPQLPWDKAYVDSAGQAHITKAWVGPRTWGCLPANYAGLCFWTSVYCYLRCRIAIRNMVDSLQSNLLSIHCVVSDSSGHCLLMVMDVSQLNMWQQN